jgi:hypothetical protein
MRPVRYRDKYGVNQTATLYVRDGHRRASRPIGTSDTAQRGERMEFNLPELRSALETEAFKAGPVIPGGKGAKVGMRSRMTNVTPIRDEKQEKLMRPQEFADHLGQMLGVPAPSKRWLSDRVRDGMPSRRWRSLSAPTGRARSAIRSA